MVNFTDLARQAQLTARTVQSYYQILEDTLIGFTFAPWQNSLRKRLTTHPKFYFFDTGVVNSINRRLSAPPDFSLRGRLFEQWLILETFRLASYLRSETRLFYWRTNTGAEVDLILEKHGKILGAFEIKSSKILGGRDFSGLRAFSQDHPKVPLWIVADVEERFLHRLADQRVRSKVHDGMRLVLGHHRVYCRAVCQVALDKRSLGVNRLLVALVQVVKDDDLVTGLDQLLDGDAADISRAARN